MTAIINRKIAAKIEGDFVVFLVGARINRPWLMHKYLWLARTMPTMLKELEARPESGFLGYQQLNLMTNVQYWRSFEQLTAYARNPDATHFPAWVRFNKEIRTSGDVGVWHETYMVRAGEYEAVYVGMPPFGLAKVAGHVDAVGQQATAAGRAGKSDGSDAPVTTADREHG